jgi:hypothetical protein
VVQQPISEHQANLMNYQPDSEEIKYRHLLIEAVDCSDGLLSSLKALSLAATLLDQKGNENNARHILYLCEADMFTQIGLLQETLNKLREFRDKCTS